MSRNTSALARATCIALAALATVAGAQTPSGQWAIKPAKGQDQAQTQKDVTACQGEAQAHAGAAPADAVRRGQAPAAAVAPATKGGAGKGALGGAAAGAVIGEIASNDAGSGAAIGGAVGAIGGAVRRDNARKEADAKRAAAEQERAARQQSASQQVEQYNLAFRNCLSGRGYSVSLSQPGAPAAPAAAPAKR
jgi:hypothetical protein